MSVIVFPQSYYVGVSRKETPYCRLTVRSSTGESFKAVAFGEAATALARELAMFAKGSDLRDSRMALELEGEERTRSQTAQSGAVRTEQFFQISKFTLMTGPAAELQLARRDGFEASARAEELAAKGDFAGAYAAVIEFTHAFSRFDPASLAEELDAEPEQAPAASAEPAAAPAPEAPAAAEAVSPPPAALEPAAVVETAPEAVAAVPDADGETAQETVASEPAPAVHEPPADAQAEPAAADVDAAPVAAETAETAQVAVAEEEPVPAEVVSEEASADPAVAAPESDGPISVPVAEVNEAAEIAEAAETGVPAGEVAAAGPVPDLTVLEGVSFSFPVPAEEPAAEQAAAESDAPAAAVSPEPETAAVPEVSAAGESAPAENPASAPVAEPEVTAAAPEPEPVSAPVAVASPVPAVSVPPVRPAFGAARFGARPARPLTPGVIPSAAPPVSASVAVKAAVVAQPVSMLPKPNPEDDGAQAFGMTVSPPPVADPLDAPLTAAPPPAARGFGAGRPVFGRPRPGFAVKTPEPVAAASAPGRR